MCVGDNCVISSTDLTNSIKPANNLSIPTKQSPKNLLKNMPKTEVELYSDSQGRGIAQYLNDLSSGKLNVTGYIFPNAHLEQVYSHISNLKISPLIIVAGTNNTLTSTYEAVYKNLEKRLLHLSENKQVFISTIPTRYDADILDPVHNTLHKLNNYIREVVARMENVHLIDLSILKRYHFTRQGLHLNRRGKKSSHI